MLNIAITGATGAVGSTVAHHLAAAGLTARLVVRDPSRAPDLPGFDVAVAPPESPARLRRSFEGIDTVFMVSAHEHDERRLLHQDLIDVAVQAGVRHVVYLSFVGAAEDSVNVFARDHGATESYLWDCGLDVTILRSNYYAETLVQFVHDAEISGPAGDGRIAAVARGDVAAAAAAVMADPVAHVGQVYELTGPEALTFHEAAAVLGPVLGRRITYVPQSDEDARRQKSRYGAPEPLLDAWLSAYVAIRHGLHGHVTDDVRHLTGRPPVTATEALSHLQE